MSEFRLYTSNKLENLINKLIKTLSIPLSTPFKQETIIIQSKGMERWISMQLASYFGIQANTQFPFPNSVINNIFKLLLGYSSNNSLFRPEVLAWRIMSILPGLLRLNEFLSIKNYLLSNTEENSISDFYSNINSKKDELYDYKNLKLYQLSSLIADTFDQYLFYRPGLIFSWERNDLSLIPENNAWQAILWQKVIKESAAESNTHRAELRRMLLEKLNTKSPDLSMLPERISLFGISVLPPYHLEIFSALSKHIDINFFLLNPCRELWSYISSESEIASKTFMKGKSFDPLHLERGNKLLSSLGRMGREFFSIIHELGFDNEPGYFKIDDFTEIKTDTILSVLQSDILNLIDRKHEDKYKLKEIDNSIQIHNCHGPLREVEVLYDQILNMFESDKDLKQEDILVMIPDIDSYVPYIQSVFSNSDNNISYNISDRKLFLESNIINTFFYILNLNDSRFSVQSILKLFEIDSIISKSGFNQDDIALIKDWIIKTNIKWGYDKETKKELSLPAYKENTWKEGISRLLLGYSMTGESLFNEIMPYQEIEISKSEVLNNFIKFINLLADIVNRLKNPDTLTNWSIKLRDIISEIFSTDNNTEKEIQLLTNSILSLKELEDSSGFNKELGIKTVSYFLKSKLNSKSLSFSFLSGGITFCAMLPMRSIPFDVICLLGMNNNSFPGKNSKLDFDLISKSPRAGDRSRKKDDRYLFLETILSARKILYISYTGQSINDNTELQPSILINELLDTINESFESNFDLTSNIITKHKLQAFNKIYFSEHGKYFSYSKENYDACLHSINKKQQNNNFLKLSLPEPEIKLIDINSLCYFFKNPCKYLLNKRFNIYLNIPQNDFSDTECFTLNNLEKYYLANDLLELTFNNIDPIQYYSIVKAKGILPHGNIGKIIYFDILNEVLYFRRQLEDYIDEQSFISISLQLNNLIINGNISFIKDKNIHAQYRYAKLKPFDMIKLWIYHLILCSYFNSMDYPDKNNFKSIFLSKDKNFEFNYINNSNELLVILLDKFVFGNSNTLLFFPETSMKLAETLFKINSNQHDIISQKTDLDLALKSAKKIWNGNEFIKNGEKNDLYYEYCFKENEPLNTQFIKTSVDIFYPLLKAENSLKI